MRSLIYTVAVGQEYEPLGRMLMDSIRAAGSAADLLTINPRGSAGGISAKHLKVRVQEFTDLARYDFVLFLDADTLVQRNPDAILERMAGEDRIYTQEGRMHVRDFSLCFTPEQLAEHGHKTHYNSGMVGFRPNGEGARMLRLWQEYCERFQCRDQWALNAVLCLHGLATGWVPDAAYFVKPANYKETFLHFVGDNKFRMKDHFDYLCGTQAGRKYEGRAANSKSEIRNQKLEINSKSEGEMDRNRIGTLREWTCCGKPEGRNPKLEINSKSEGRRNGGDGVALPWRCRQGQNTGDEADLGL